ncbi:MAG TPA: TylF/MycF/NovP-related O-methyltransferase [Gaiellaceae bacterium]
MRVRLGKVAQKVNGHLVRLFAPTVGEAAERAAQEYFFDVYVRERLYRQEFFSNAFKALRFNGIDGDYAEFGSWGGMTFALAHQEARRRGHPAKLWAFDSFKGLPSPQVEADEHPEWRTGRLSTTLEEFHATCAKNDIPRDAYEVIPGFYENTLSTMSITDEPTNIALAYVDCDLYSSTRAVLRFLEPRLKHGMIVAFDDYFCWSPSQISGERKALLEVTSDEDKWEWTPYVQFGWHGASFVIEDKSLTEAASTAVTRERPAYKLLAAAAALYLVMPFDLIPDFIPVVGHFDDAIVLGLLLHAFKQEWSNGLRTLWGARRVASQSQIA